MKITFEQSATPELLALMWSTFFLERRRGRSLFEHFPWLADPGGADVWLATILDSAEQPSAALVVKRHFDHPDTASIGLVCVRQDLRGQGLSQNLLSGSIREAHSLGMTSLTLWTGKPSVYLQHGFETRDQALFGWVSQTARSPSSKAAPRAKRVTWPDAAERQAANRGLPAFAGDAYRLLDDSNHAQAIVVVDANGPIVAEWAGAAVDVMELLRAALPATWRLNALRGDPLVAALADNAFVLDLFESRLQMWRIDADARQITTPILRMLDRI
jgi:GNAT superfamily N-acetyltransferase